MSGGRCGGGLSLVGVKMDALSFHVPTVMAFNASWEMMAGLFSWIGELSDVSLVGV